MSTRAFCCAAFFVFAICGLAFSENRPSMHTIRGFIEAPRMPDLLILAPRGAEDAQDLTRATISARVDPDGRFQVDLAPGSYIVAYYPPCTQVTDIRITEGTPSIELALVWLPSKWLARAGAAGDMHLSAVSPGASGRDSGFGSPARMKPDMGPNATARSDYGLLSASLPSAGGRSGVGSYGSTGKGTSSFWPQFEYPGRNASVSTARFDFSLSQKMMLSGLGPKGAFGGIGGTGTLSPFSGINSFSLVFSSSFQRYGFLPQNMSRWSNSSLNSSQLWSTKYSSSLTFSSTSLTNSWNWKWTVQKYCFPGLYGKMCGGILLDGTIPCD